MPTRPKRPGPKRRTGAGEAAAAPLHPASPGASSRRRARLDDADVRIMELLTEDGRASNRFIGEQVGLTEATVAARIRSLVADRIFAVRAIFDWEAAGFTWSMYVFISVEGRPIIDVAEELRRLEPVHAVAVVFGSVDIVLHALFPTREDVARFLDDDLGGVKGVARVSSTVTLEVVKFTANFGASQIDEVGFGFPDPPVEIDDLDHTILEVLVQDGRMSNREIARQLSISDGTVRARVKRLEGAGLIRICAQIDPFRAGTSGVLVYVAVRTRVGFTRSVAERIAERSESIVVMTGTGAFDILMFAATASRQDLVALVADHIRTLEGVVSTETWDVFHALQARTHWVRILD